MSLELPSSPTPAPLDKKDWIAGLEKGLSIIETFDDAHPRLSASQAGERCGLTRTAARRYLLTLTHLGYVATDGKLFWLTPRVMRLGQSYLESARLPRIVQPFLQRLTAGTQEISYVSVLDGTDIVYVARNGTNRAMNTGFVLGARVPGQVTAAGMLLLAIKDRMRLEMVRIRAQGWAISEQQLDLSYRGVAVPLRDHKGALIAALSVSMPMTQESSDEAANRVLPLLRETAAAMMNLI